MSNTCGHSLLPDNFQIIEGAKAVEFKDHKLYWHVSNMTPDMTKEEQVEAFRVVFEDMNDRLAALASSDDVPLRFESVSEIDRHPEHTIILTWADNKGEIHGKPPIPFADTVLAYAFPPHSYYRLKIWINEDFYWQTKPSDITSYQPLRVIQHEVFHNLGIGHTEDEKALADRALMAPKIYPDTAWHTDDYAALLHLYKPQIENKMAEKKKFKLPRLVGNVVAVLLRKVSGIFIDKIPDEETRKGAEGMVKALSNTARALSDDNPRDKEQIREIYRKFTNTDLLPLADSKSVDALSRIKNERIREPLLVLQPVLVDIVNLMSDDNPENEEQVNAYWQQVLRDGKLLDILSEVVFPDAVEAANYD